MTAPSRTWSPLSNAVISRRRTRSSFVADPNHQDSWHLRDVPMTTQFTHTTRSRLALIYRHSASFQGCRSHREQAALKRAYHHLLLAPARLDSRHIAPSQGSAPSAQQSPEVKRTRTFISLPATRSRRGSGNIPTFSLGTTRSRRASVWPENARQRPPRPWYAHSRMTRHQTTYLRVQELRQKSRGWPSPDYVVSPWQSATKVARRHEAALTDQSEFRSNLQIGAGRRAPWKLTRART